MSSSISHMAKSHLNEVCIQAPPAPMSPCCQPSPPIRLAVPMPTENNVLQRRTAIFHLTFFPDTTHSAAVSDIADSFNPHHIIELICPLGS
jgi:hypothetical protein